MSLALSGRIGDYNEGMTVVVDQPYYPKCPLFLINPAIPGHMLILLFN
jgi:hypothetical protein